MASIPIYRYDYGSSEYNGYPPNAFTEAMSAVTLTSASTGNEIGWDGDFKDHKTLFTFVNTSGGSASVTFKAGDTYRGVKDLVLSCPSGTTHIWLNSADFVDKRSGEIKVLTDVASLAAYGVEMR